MAQKTKLVFVHPKNQVSFYMRYKIKSNFTRYTNRVNFCTKTESVLWVIKIELLFPEYKTNSILASRESVFGEKNWPIHNLKTNGTLSCIAFNSSVQNRWWFRRHEAWGCILQHMPTVSLFVGCIPRPKEIVTINMIFSCW